ncbi:magnesium chelatase subunit D [Acidisoma sp.]|uniref:magnesium chelatase subunit D n=1 Tax=Acidisoma sp. TaxID=1872115 RepID=UPI003AFF88DC
MSDSSTAASAWTVATVVARLFAHDPFGTGIQVKAAAGPVRDRFLGMLRAMMPVEAPWSRCPATIADDRLLGGLDLGVTLASGQAAIARGLLAEADGGIVVIGSAERLSGATAARLAAMLDLGEVAAERDGFTIRHPARVGLVLLDEGTEESLPLGLADRLAFRIELDGVRLSETMAVSEEATAHHGPVTADAAVVEALCATAEALGIGSARAEWLALRVARAAAALDGRHAMTEADATLAAQLVLAHRATRVPQSAGEPGAPEPEDAAPDLDKGEAANEEAEAPSAEELAMAEALAEAVLQAAVASLPPDLLAQLAAGGPADRHGGRQAGRVTAKPSGTRRGRPIASRPGRPNNGLRLDVVETLRAAAPWQRLRRNGAGGRIAFRAGDLHVRRYKSAPRATTVFVVDASGSAALNRLAEAKGAVELMLAECYLRRDQVALFAFRGTGAELLLPPTGALARARRCLGALPGGGGTPLAAGMEAARALAETLRRQGETPKLVMLTDGRANVALDGVMDRSRAMADAERVARHLRASGLPALVIDISPRPQPEAARIAAAMGARCLVLPRADAAAVSRAVRAAA